MEHLKDLVNNYLMASAFIAWFVAQIIKVVVGLFDKEDRRNIFHVMFSTGGMPSSHSSAVTALCISAAIMEGLGSPIFAITFILAGVVMIDASGVRYETGKQAQIINKITKKLFSENSQEVNAGLKELVGHTPFQVLMGSILGFATAIVMGFVMGYLHI
ncbi:MAG: divergent PAP2 family protein [Clostridia bacterium]|nr:divergent PAP2 family protein [Clostridia bacterium]